MHNRILIVEDAELNRELLKSILEEEYEIEEASDGEEALKILIDHWNNLDAVLLDIYMPNMNGFQLLDYMAENGWIQKLPVLVISGEQSVEIENRCFERGVSDFIHKPFYASLVKQRVKNIVELFGYKNRLEEQVKEQTYQLKMQNEILQVQAKKLHKHNDRIVEILGTVVEYRNLESGEHIQRVKGFTEILANQVMQAYPEFGLTTEKIKEIVAASALHDVGKITIPDKILLKPGRLTDDEYEYMKSHTTRGCDMLDSIKDIWTDDYRKLCYEICRFHHERYDGNGYPDKLKGEEIPIAAQIVSVADVYDALVSERIYKNSYSKDEAFRMIVNGECGIFSPKLMECFRMVKDAFEKIADKNRDGE